MRARGLSVLALVALLLPGCTDGGDDPKPQASATPTPSASELESFPGVDGQAVADLLSSTGGYDCDGPEDHGRTLSWKCSRFGAGATYKIWIWGEAPDRIGWIYGSVRAENTKSLEAAAIPLITEIATTRYTGANRNQVQLWAVEHVGDRRAELEVGGALFSLRTRTESLTFHMLAPGSRFVQL